MGALREHLKRSLPDYMVPGPLYPNDKVDRKALPAPVAGDAAPVPGSVAPRTPTEETVMGVFRDVLKRADFGVFDNFFDLGGHSLTAVRLMSRLRAVSGLNLTASQSLRVPDGCRAGRDRRWAVVVGEVTGASPRSRQSRGDRGVRVKDDTFEVVTASRKRGVPRSRRVRRAAGINRKKDSNKVQTR